MDTISFGPDREPRRWLPGLRWPGWRDRPRRPSGRAWLAILAAGVAAVAGLVVVTTRHPGRRPASGPVAAAMAPLLSGVPARSVHTSLIIGGDYLWRLGTGRPRTVLGGLLAGGRSPLLPRAVGAAGISQLVPVPGGVVALMSDISSQPADSGAGPVLFIPSGTGPARLITRASVIAVVPGGRSVWVQTARQPSSIALNVTARPVISPTFAVSLAGHRVSPVLRLPLGLVAATRSGLLTNSVTSGRIQLWNSATGRPEPVSLPDGTRVVGEGGGLVIWQSTAWPARRLHVTDLRARGGTIAVPAGWWPVRYQEPVASDASGQRLVLPLGRVDSSGNLTVEALYVFDPAARTLRPVPGGPAATSQPLDLGNAGVELAGAWDQRGRLWVLASSGYGYFQLGYWTGAGPLHVYPPEPGNPAAFSASGSGS